MSDKCEESAGKPVRSERIDTPQNAAMNAALRETFKALLDEPVPERFKELIARIRTAEARKAGKTDESED